MKNSKLRIFVFLVFSLLIISSSVFASTTDGTIDSTYKYAYGENVGFIDFGSTAGAVHITDSSLSGSAYGENIGWINLSGVTNSNGTLSGYAWGENVGFIDFSKVTIGDDGVFSGSAYGENIGWITFSTDNNNKVVTDWRKPSLRSTPSSHSSSGSSVSSRYQNLIAMGKIDEANKLQQEFPNQISSTTPTTQILGSGKCSPELIITDNLKQGARDGKYHIYNNGTVKQVNILQSHINRILASSYKEASGPVDGVFGKLTKQGVMRLQEALNTTLKPTPLLKIDGIVGPFTKEAINNSCGK